MKNTFAELVDAAASFQFHSEDLMHKLDGYIQEAKDFKDVGEAEREALLNTLYALKPLVIQALASNEIKKSFEK